MAPAIAYVVAAVAVLISMAPCWGPGTHITLTREILRRLGGKKRLNRRQLLVLRHPQPFVYGNVAADVINFKAYGGAKNHCHNWNIQERLEAVAAGEPSEAFILGYLCHLAADVVSHNHFVPYHVVYNFPPRLLGHMYWEAMADSNVSDVEWHTVDHLKDTKHIRVFDAMVHRVVKRRAFSLRSNRWIFDNILLINCRRSWRRMIRGLRLQKRKHPLDERFYQRCRTSSLRQMLAVFYPRRLSLLKLQDPTGKFAIQGARRLRRELLRDFGMRSKARDVARALAYAAYSKLP